MNSWKQSWCIVVFLYDNILHHLYHMPTKNCKREKIKQKNSITTARLKKQMYQGVTQIEWSNWLPLTHDKCLNKTLGSMSLLWGSRYYNFSFHSSRLWISNSNVCIRDLCGPHSRCQNHEELYNDFINNHTIQQIMSQLNWDQKRGIQYFHFFTSTLWCIGARGLGALSLTSMTKWQKHVQCFTLTQSKHTVNENVNYIYASRLNCPLGPPLVSFGLYNFDLNYFYSQLSKVGPLSFINFLLPNTLKF